VRDDGAVIEADNGEQHGNVMCQCLVSLKLFERFGAKHGGKKTAITFAW